MIDAPETVQDLRGLDAGTLRAMLLQLRRELEVPQTLKLRRRKRAAAERIAAYLPAGGEA